MPGACPRRARAGIPRRHGRADDPRLLRSDERRSVRAARHIAAAAAAYDARRMGATVLLCDDHPVFRDGLARVVRNGPGLELVGVAEGGREALARIRAQAPDVALVDLRLPDLDG